MYETDSSGALEKGTDDAIEASLVHTVQDEWLRLEPIRLGQIPSGLGTPDFYVTVSEQGVPLARVDVYARGEEFVAFQEVVAWQRTVVIALGSHVHVLSLIDRRMATVRAGRRHG